MNARCTSGPAVREGRPAGGPPFFLAGLLVFAACGGGPPGEPTPRADGVVARPLETYRQLGLLAGPPEFPAVVDVSTLAGPADSTWVIVAMSLPNSALRFERDGAGFAASYHVEAMFRRDTTLVRRIERTETVRVSSFAEAGRTDESVIFQQATALAPGRHVMAFRAEGESTSRRFEAVDTIDVPAYGSAALALAGPLFIFEGAGRTVRAALPQVILNPRHTSTYGGAEPKLYVEWYGGGDAVPLEVRILDERREPVQRLAATVAAGDSEVRSATVELPTGSLPLGRHWVEVSRAGEAATGSEPLLLSISDQWMVANFEEVLQFIRYIATPDEVDQLRNGTAQERRERWDAFWRRRDPLPATPVNEFRDQFFDRVRYATEHFAEAGGLQGWHTDRGEVYIVLGPPDLTRDRAISTNDMLQPDGIEWTYDSLPGGRLSLLFIDRTGFGRFELTPSSQTSFRSMADRLRPRSE